MIAVSAPFTLTVLAIAVLQTFRHRVLLASFPGLPQLQFLMYSLLSIIVNCCCLTDAAPQESEDDAPSIPLVRAKICLHSQGSCVGGWIMVKI